MVYKPGLNDWVNNREAGDLRRHCGHYDVIVKERRLKEICYNGVFIAFQITSYSIVILKPNNKEKNKALYN